MNRVAVIVLNWNGAEALKSCLSSLFEQTIASTLVVVDNGSTDGSLEFLQPLAKAGRIELIKNKSNLGFAGGINVGFRWAAERNFQSVALLNNDAVADKNWLKSLVTVLDERPEVAVATGLLLSLDGQTIDSAGDFYSLWGLAFPRGRDEPAEEAPESGYVFGATGGASLYRMSALLEVGFFDERFFAYYEDIDLSFRLQLAGWRVFYTQEAIAYHHRGLTSGRLRGFTTWQTVKNVPQLYLKNVPSGLLLKIGGRLAVAFLMVVANRWRQTGFRPVARCLVDGLKMAPSSILLRKKIQRSRSVDLSYLETVIYPDLPPTHKRWHKRFKRVTGR